MELISSNLKDQNPSLIINFVLDQSGSMSYKKDSTIEAFNKYVEDLQKNKLAERKGQVVMSLIFFEDEPEIKYACKEISEVQFLTQENYKPYGNTALNDAIALTVLSVEDSLKEWEQKPAILTVILTDGEENASKEFGGFKGQKKIEELIKRKEAEGNWTFVFLSEKPTQQEAQTQSMKYGISGGNTMSYHGTKGVIHSIGQLSKATECYVSACAMNDSEKQTYDFFNFPNKELFKTPEEDKKS